MNKDPMDVLRTRKKRALELLREASKAIGEDMRVLFSESKGNGYYCIRKDRKRITDDHLSALQKALESIWDISDVTFELAPFDKGFVFWFPTENSPSFYFPQKLFKVLMDSVEWCDLVGFAVVEDLNEVISKSSIRDMILMQEAQVEARIANLARHFAGKSSGRIIMIAGPSSSGKTTFSHRLSIQLKSMGYKPHPIALDDYYLDRDKTPLDEFGNKDYETVYSLDIDRFQQDMQSLLSGKETRLPVFDFTTGSRAGTYRKLKLDHDDILVVEGINGLNDVLTDRLPVESIFKIYISGLNILSLSDYEPMSTSDIRLMRRIVRDARVRGTPAQGTLSMWPSVRRGEHKNIFPYQDDADEVFNTALIYELSVMKLYAEPLLRQIDESEPEYSEAKRLLALLENVLPIPTEDIPNNSLIREFIGGGCFGI